MDAAIKRLFAHGDRAALIWKGCERGCYLDVLAASLLHGELEVDVLRHADLLIKQRGLALVAQLLPPAQNQGHHCQSLPKRWFNP